MSKCVAVRCENEGWAAEPILGVAFCFTHWATAKASFVKDGNRLKDTYPYGGKSGHRNVKVYFLASKRYVKIGSSMDPRARLQAFRSGIDCSIQPDDIDRENLECIGWFRDWNDLNQRRLERQLHQKFAAHRVVGEWFHKNPRLMADIKEIVVDAPAEIERAA